MPMCWRFSIVDLDRLHQINAFHARTRYQTYMGNKLSHSNLEPASLTLLSSIANAVDFSPLLLERVG